MESTNTSEKIKDYFLIFILVLSVLLFRRYDAFVYPQLWAEDGPVFLQQYLEQGIKSLIIPYGGYLNSAQRIIVYLSAFVPIKLFHLPRLYTIICFGIMLLIAFQSYRTANYLNLRHNLIYATFFLFTPITSDVFMNITNLNGILSLYLINFLLTRNNGNDKILLLNLIIIFITGLSGPASILLSPVVIVILYMERKQLTARKFLPLALILLCGLIQLICIKFIDKNFYRGITGPAEPYHLLKLFTNNIHDLLFLQYDFMAAIPPFLQTTLCIVTFFLLSVFFIISYRRIRNEKKYILLLSAVFYLLGVIASYWPNESKLLGLGNAARYFLVPYACIGWILIIAWDQKIKLAHIIIYVSFLFFQRKHIRVLLEDKNWKKQIEEYYDGKREIIDINPEGWKFRLPKIETK